LGSPVCRIERRSFAANNLKERHLIAERGAQMWRAANQLDDEAHTHGVASVIALGEKLRHKAPIAPLSVCYLSMDDFH